MDKYISFEENAAAQTSFTSFTSNKTIANLDSILKKCLDYEGNTLDYDDINRIIDLFQKMSHYELRSPIYFTLGYLATNGRHWDSVWMLMDWLSKWVGQPLNPISVIKYHRHIQNILH